MKKLLVVIDYQNDFVSGPLGFEGAEKLAPKLKEAIDSFLSEKGFVLFTRDTHKEDYLETREGKHLPLPHCIEGQEGQQLYGALHSYELTPKLNTLILNKSTFGCNKIGEQALTLCKGEPDLVEICGLVTDICVVTNAILLHTALPNSHIRVVEALCGSGNKQNAANALAVLRGLGIEVL